MWRLMAGKCRLRVVESSWEELQEQERLSFDGNNLRLSFL